MNRRVSTGRGLDLTAARRNRRTARQQSPQIAPKEDRERGLHVVEFEPMHLIDINANTWLRSARPKGWLLLAKLSR
jgi:hypothetical protein